MFENRQHAGEELGKALQRYKNQQALVLGIPRGGVETAYYVAKKLNAELGIIIARKLGYPGNPEAAFGAVAEDGSLYLSEMARKYVTEAEMQQVIDAQRMEITRRIATLRSGKGPPDMKGRLVILVDDGIATGATLFASISMCRHQGADKLVVAAPVADRSMEHDLKRLVDDVVILLTPEGFEAVSQGYREFRNLTDEEALAFLTKWNQENARRRQFD